VQYASGKNDFVAVRSKKNYSLKHDKISLNMKVKNVKGKRRKKKKEGNSISSFLEHLLRLLSYSPQVSSAA